MDKLIKDKQTNYCYTVILYILVVDTQYKRIAQSLNGACRYTCVQYRLYTPESLHSIQLYTLMVFVNFTVTLHVTQSLLFECLLNVFGNTVTNHSRCTRHSGVRNSVCIRPNDYWLVDYYSMRLTCSVNLCGRANMHLS